MNENVRRLHTWTFKVYESAGWSRNSCYTYTMLIIFSISSHSELGILMWPGFDLNIPRAWMLYWELVVMAQPRAHLRWALYHFLISWHLVTLGFLGNGTSKTQVHLYFIHILTHLLTNNYLATIMCETKGSLMQAKDRSVHQSLSSLKKDKILDWI